MTSHDAGQSLDSMVHSGQLGGAADVSYAFICDDATGEYLVVDFEASEELNRPYRVEVRLRAVDEGTDTTELLGRDAVLTLTRGGQLRELHGIVSQVRVTDHGPAARISEVTLVPALATLALGRNTRIFQEQTVLQILEAVLGEGLGPQDRSFELAIAQPEQYPVRDYCVQYQESDLDFVHRLLEEEGLGYYFETRERECVVVFDDNRRLLQLATGEGGAVQHGRASGSPEPIVWFTPGVRLHSDGLTVRDHDWTRGRPTLEETREPAEARPGRSVYEHGFARSVTITEDNEILATLVGALERAVIPSFMPSPFVTHSRELIGSPLIDFTDDNVPMQTRIRHELQQRDRRMATGAGMVTGLAPGRRFLLVGHPTIGADGEYYVTRVRHSSAMALLERAGDRPRPSELATERAGDAGNYANEFECLPVTTPWRPARVTRKPRIYGVQTARVVAPAGMEVHTDQHGRVKAKFQWDRTPDDPLGQHSCWLRVSQVWAGAGHPGFMFIPRVGMEVVVSFVDGDPDRPLITGCVHNGNNHPPDILPFRATKSVIRTRTIPFGPGYNELSFEDAMGMEEIYLKAQRNLREDVECNHVTHVKETQLNQVDGDQIQHVGGNQRTVVQGDQSLVVNGGHTLFAEGAKVNILGTMNVRIGHGESISVESGSRSVRVEDGEHALVAGGRFLISQGGQNHIVLHSHDDSDGPKGIHIETPDTVLVTAGQSKLTLNEDGAGSIKIESPVSIELVVGGSKLQITPEMIKANNKTFPAS